jgi:dynein heavy chain 1
MYAFSSMVYIHNSVAEANVRLAKRTGRNNYLTPRHFLDFIKHYVSLINGKREELEEQQLHLNVGLQKLRDTQEQVRKLQEQLHVKSQELEAKNALANEKLKQMVADQQVRTSRSFPGIPGPCSSCRRGGPDGAQVAETKRAASLELQKQIEKQNEEIKVRKARSPSFFILLP